MGELKDKAKGTANELVGEAKQKSSDPETQAEGKAQERKGEVQNAKGEVKGAFGDKVEIAAVRLVDPFGNSHDGFGDMIDGYEVER